MSASDLAKAKGLTKEVYGKINDIRPEGIKLTKRVKFSQGDAIGLAFNEPVMLTHENGFTYSADPNGAPVDLNGPESAQMENARIKAAEIILQNQSGYKLITSTMRQGEAAFKRWASVRSANMKLSFEKRLEISMLYGGALEGIGQPSARVTDSDTTQVYSLTLASYAPGIWAAMEGAKIDAYDVSGSPSKLNANADIRVSAVKPSQGASLPEVTLVGNETDLDAINSAIADARFFFKGAFGNEALGLVPQVTNTGLMHEINAATYGLWRGNDVTAGSNDLTWEKVGVAIGDAVGRGLDEDVVLQVSIPTWGNLHNNLAALRMLDSSYKPDKATSGSKAIEFYYMNGKITVEPSIFQKFGSAVWYVPEQLKRIGSTDQTFQVDADGTILFHVPGKSALEMRCYSDQALLVRRPAVCGRINTIVNSF